MVAAGILAIGTGGCGDNDSSLPATATESPAAAPFPRGKTLSCFRSRGATVEALRPADPQLRALRDLARGRAFDVRMERTMFAIAFTRDVAAADLLVELVTAPGGAYEPVSRGNVVLLHRSNGSGMDAALARCLGD